MLQDWPGQPAVKRGPGHRPLRYAALVLAVVLVVIGALLVVVFHNSGNYYVFSPGTAPILTTSARCTGPSQLTLPNGQPCVRISVPSNLAHAGSGQLFMVDVDVGKATPSDYVLNELGLLASLRSGSQLIPAKLYTGGLSSSQVQCQDVAEMNGSQEDAPVAALRRLGYRVPETDRGAVVAQVNPGTPAVAAGLHCNDVITAVNGRPVHTAADLVNAVRLLRPGQSVRLQRQSVGAGGKVVTSVTTATLTTISAAAAKQSGAAPGTAYLGVTTATDVSYHLPFPVTIDAGDIGGPSAGLAFTLGIINLLSGGHLTGGHRVAATGEIDANGNVIEVGGAAQKTVAVERAGATVFIVPKGDYAAAESQSHGKLKVFPVTTLNQALADLASIGGTVPPTNFATSHPSS